MPTTREEITSLALWGTPADTGATGRLAAASNERNLRDVIQAIGQILPDLDSHERARLRHRLGYLALLAGDVRAKAIEAFTMTRDGARLSHDRPLEGLANIGLSIAFDHVGQRRDALQCAEEAERIAEELGDQRLLALALNSQAQYYKENGENTRAFELFKCIEATGKALNDEELQMGAIIGMGRTTPMSEAFTAIGYYEQAIDMAKARNDDEALIVCTNNLADWMIIIGELDKAIALRETCLSLSQKLQSRPGIGRALIGLAKAYTLKGDLPKARALLNKGYPVVLSSSDLEGELHSSLNLAYLHIQDGDITRAADLYRQVLEKSLAAPDHACAIFAQKALELLADGQTPDPAALMPQASFSKSPNELRDEELEGVVGGAHGQPIYPTGDVGWHVGL